MSERTALHYQNITKGQIVAFRHADGCWYLYAPQPVDDESAATGRAAVVGRRW